MPASSPGLVVGKGASAAVTINGQPLGCVVGDAVDDLQRAIQSYQSLCDDAGAYEQGTPGALTRNVSTTVEYIVNGAGINAAEAAAKSGALATCGITFSGQTSGVDSGNYSGFVTGVRKSVSAGAATGQVAFGFRVVADA